MASVHIEVILEFDTKVAIETAVRDVLKVLKGLGNFENFQNIAELRSHSCDFLYFIGPCQKIPRDLCNL